MNSIHRHGLLVAAGSLLLVLQASPQASGYEAKYELAKRNDDGSLAPAKASAYKAAKPELDANGVVSLVSDDGQRYYHPFNVATQALADDGVEGTAGLVIGEMVKHKPVYSDAQKAALDWLIRNKVELPNGAIVWAYPLPLYYTTFTLEPGWPSAFSQGRIIHAFLYFFLTTGEDQYLKLAIAAGKAYATPVSEGGLLDHVDRHPFFEEVPVPGGHSPHILNGHLYSVVALSDLATVSQDETIKQLVADGLKSAKLLANYYDLGTWTKYDLVPRVSNIMFLIKGHDNPINIQKAMLIGPDKRQYALQLVSVDGVNSIFKANLPGDMFVNSVIGRPDYRLDLEYSGDLAAVGIAGTRPESPEFYQLPLANQGMGTFPSSAVFRVPNQLLSDSSLSRIYQRWHARLMKRLGEQNGDRWFFNVGLRWWAYDQQLEEELERPRAPGPILRQLPPLAVQYRF